MSQAIYPTCTEVSTVHVAPDSSITPESSAYYNAGMESTNHKQVFGYKSAASKLSGCAERGPLLLMGLLLVCVTLQLVIIYLRVTDKEDQLHFGVSSNCSQLQEPADNPSQADRMTRSQLLSQCLREEIDVIKRKTDSLDNRLKALQPSQQKIAKPISAIEYLGSGDRSIGKLYISHGAMANFTDAVEICAKAGGQLASPRNVEENNAVYAIRSQYGATPFLGINDIQTEGIFRYPNGEPITYTNWNIPEPNNDHGYEDCVEMYIIGTWNDKQCKEIRLVICEF